LVKNSFQEYGCIMEKAAADPPRRLLRFRRAAPKTKRPPLLAAVCLAVIVMRIFFVLGRTGSDLLFQVLRLSTIGAGEFYGRVRDGIGYRPPAKTTSPAKDE
jgi:hypothetical protein